jgi:hypothetical protein
MSYLREAGVGEKRGQGGKKGSRLQARDQGGWEFATMIKGPSFHIRVSIFLADNTHPLIIIPCIDSA